MPRVFMITPPMDQVFELERRDSIQSHIDLVLTFGLVLDPEAALGDGLSYTYNCLILAVDQSYPVLIVEAD